MSRQAGALVKAFCLIKLLHGPGHPSQAGSYSPYSGQITPDLENVRVEVVPAGANLYGSLRSAQLSAKAYLISAQVSNELGDDGEYVGYDFHVISEGAVDGRKLTVPVVPDIQDDGYDIDIHQLHFVLIVGHARNSAHCIPVRNVQQAVGKYERVGYLHQVDYEKWLGMATAHDLILVQQESTTFLRQALLLGIEVSPHGAPNVQSHVSSLVALKKGKRKVRTDIEDVERTLKTWATVCGGGWAQAEMVSKPVS